MKINLEPCIESDVLRIVEQYGYDVSEVISLGVKILDGILQERSGGNQVVIRNDAGVFLSELSPPEPRAITQYLSTVAKENP